PFPKGSRSREPACARLHEAGGRGHLVRRAGHSDRDFDSARSLRRASTDDRDDDKRRSRDVPSPGQHQRTNLCLCDRGDPDRSGLECTLAQAEARSARPDRGTQDARMRDHQEASIVSEETNKLVNVNKRKRRPWLRRLVWIALGLMALALVVIAVQPKPVEVELARATRGVFSVTVDEDGVTRVTDRFIISAPLAGQ